MRISETDMKILRRAEYNLKMEREQRTEGKKCGSN